MGALKEGFEFSEARVHWYLEKNILFLIRNRKILMRLNILII